MNSDKNAEKGDSMKIDWAYLRKGWKSCQKAQAVLERKGIKIGEIVEARKEKIGALDAWELLSPAAKIVVSKGKKSFEFVPDDSSRQEILKLVLGRSQTLRAPTLKINDKFIVGFSEDNYETLTF